MSSRFDRYRIWPRIQKVFSFSYRDHLESSWYRSQAGYKHSSDPQKHVRILLYLGDLVIYGFLFRKEASVCVWTFLVKLLG